MGEGMSDGAFEPVVVENPDGVGPIVIVCDHASNRIPAEYASFGFEEDALQTHIAWDPGALAVARLLAADLDAPLVWPDVSRLVIDCNRAADVPSLIVTESEGRKVEANRGLSDEERKRRLDTIHGAYHAAIEACLARRQAAHMLDVADRDPFLYAGLSRQGASLAGGHLVRRRPPPGRSPHRRAKGRSER